MSSIFWDSQEVIMTDFLEQERTINGVYNTGKLRRLSLEMSSWCHAVII